jgi:hypothetical protein
MKRTDRGCGGSARLRFLSIATASWVLAGALAQAAFADATQLEETVDSAAARFFTKDLAMTVHAALAR